MFGMVTDTIGAFADIPGQVVEWSSLELPFVVVTHQQFPSPVADSLEPDPSRRAASEIVELIMRPSACCP